LIKEIAQYLILIDEGLALDGLPIDKRPFQATLTFVREFVIEVHTEQDGAKKPLKLKEFASDTWFKYLYAHVEQWYRVRYGAKVDIGSTRHFQGVSLISNTPFELLVPTTVTYPCVAAETAWLTWPDTVLPEEDVTKWILNIPDLSTYKEESRLEAISLATEVASKLRAISCRLMGAHLMDDPAKGLLAGVIVHLESAGMLILRGGKEGSFARAIWELQMACESAYKGVLQQQTGSFAESHDLFFLHDCCLPYSENVPRELLRKIPRWQEAASLRYGQGDQPTIFGIFSCYKVALTVIAEVVRNLKGLQLANIRIEIQKAPWLGE
jgi:hypothetical protein